MDENGHKLNNPIEDGANPNSVCPRCKSTVFMLYKGDSGENKAICKSCFYLFDIDNPPKFASPTTTPRKKNKTIIYIQMRGNEVGPYTINQIKNLWQNGTITADALFRYEEQEEWQPILNIVSVLEIKEQTKVTMSQTAKSRGIYVILGVLLGCLGIHNFYAGYYLRGAIQLILTGILLAIHYILVIPILIWVLIELIATEDDARGNPMT